MQGKSDTWRLALLGRAFARLCHTTSWIKRVSQAFATVR